MGTHFLWHTVSVGAMFPLGRYIMLVQDFERASQEA